MNKKPDGPVSTKHYNPMEEPTRYPLELTQDGHICLWDEEGGYKWTIAMFVPHSEGGFDLHFVGDRPLDKRVKWKHLRKIVKQFHATAKGPE